MEGKRQKANLLVSRLSSVSEQVRIPALCELRLLSKSDPEIRPLIADAGAIPFVADHLYFPSPVAQENAAATLLNLSISAREAVASTRGVLDALSHILRHHHHPPSPSPPAAVQSAAAALYSLLADEKNRPLIGSKRDILYALVDIVKNPASPARSVKDALKALFGVALCPDNRPALIALGAVGPVFGILVNDARVGIVEDASAVVAVLAACEDAGEAFKCVSGVEVLVDLIDPATTGAGSNGRIRENAIKALLNLVQFSDGDGDGDRKSSKHIKQEIMKNGGSARVLDGIEEVVGKGSPKGKTKAEALMLLLDDCCCDTDTSPRPNPTYADGHGHAVHAFRSRRSTANDDCSEKLHTRNSEPLT